MKKHLIIAGIICAALIPSAYAVTKCVALNSSSTTCTNASGSVGRSNWSVTCGSIEIQGVAFCGSQNGGSIGATSTDVTTSSTSDNNEYCWCKMVSPAVSRWVFNRSLTSPGNCANSCASFCASYAQVYASFRTALFSNLSD